MKYFLILLATFFFIQSAAAADPVGICTVSGSSTRTTDAGCPQNGVWEQIGTCTRGDVQTTSIQNDCERDGGEWSEEVLLTGTVPAGGTIVGFGNPLCPTPDIPCDIPSILGRVIRVVLGIVGAIALVMFIYGGFLWMTGASRGEKKVQYAKEVLVWTSLGLIVIFGSYLLVNFVIERVTP